MNVLVINCGSSSIKFHLYKMPGEFLFLSGKVEKDGNGNTWFEFNFREKVIKRTREGFSFSNGLNEILNEIIKPENKCLDSLEEIDVVGHRLIHGCEGGKSCVEISDSLMKHMNRCISLAPLHYPANIEGIVAVKKLLPGVLQAGAFDTAFHQTLPEKAFLYGIPLKWYKEHQIRRYGFHGTSHNYVSQKVCEITGLPFYKSKIISCHLGNGASVAAVKNGKSIDTSMGMTPVEGLLMGTRSGDIDAGALMYIQQNFNLSSEEILEMINKKGGLLGLSGVSSDFRDVLQAAKQGNSDAQIALEVFYYRIKKYIGAFAAVLGGIDAVVFTGGIGEKSSEARLAACEGLGFLGIQISKVLNKTMNGREAIISRPKSNVKVVVVPTNEELMIARQAAGVAKSKKKN